MNPPVVAVSTARDPEPEWAVQCLQSVLAQTIPCAHVYVVHGNGLGQAQSYLADVPWPHRSVALPSRGASLANLDHQIRLLSPDTIVLWVDGDDYLLHDRVVERVLDAYRHGAWLTYGQFQHAPEWWPGWAHEYDHEVVRRARYRHEPWLATHLKTFRAGLYHLISDADLRTPAGQWMTEATDLAIMFPMLEMAAERARFIPDPLYAYRSNNPLSVHNEGGDRLAYQTSEAQRVRARSPYPRLDHRPW